MGALRKDLTGEHFGRLEVLEHWERRGHNAYWLCVCDCGALKIIGGGNLGRKIFSCGCFHLEQTKKANSTHGLSETVEYHTWERMKNRCLNPNAVDFPEYGGRGITVSKRWQRSFPAFLRDMGKRPSDKHSLDRYPDNNGNYGPGNCRWATAKEQANNRRKARLA